MNSSRKIALIVGVLYVIASVAGILGEPGRAFLGAPDYLANVSANENQIKLAALLEFVMAVAVAGIPIMIYPILKQRSEGLALAYVGARVFEGVIFTVGAISLLTLLTLGQEFVAAGAPDASYFQTLGTLLQAAREWGGGVFSTLVFSLGALIFNYLLYRIRLIPRWLSGWGLLGAILYLASGFLPLFGYGSRSQVYVLLEVPLGLSEMVLALWLIVKGFNSSATASGAANTDAD